MSRGLGDVYKRQVYENVELPLIYLRVKAAQRKKMVNEILDRMNISHRARHFPQQLSGGQQQRVAIARAIARVRASASGTTTAAPLASSARAFFV